MEDAFILLTIALIGVFSIIGMKMMRGDQGSKKGHKEVKDTAIKDLIESKDHTITTYKKELQMLNGKLARFRQVEDEIEEEPGKQVSFEEITALVNQTYPQFTKLLSIFKKQVMEATKGMTLEEILNYVKQFTGNQQSTPGDPFSASQEPSPHYA